MGDEWSGVRRHPPISVAAVLVLAACSHGGTGWSERQLDARRRVREFTEQYVDDVAPTAPTEATDTKEDADCDAGARLVHTVVLDVPAAQRPALVDAFEAYWRQHWQERIGRVSGAVVISSSSGWSTRARASDRGVEVRGATACIP